MSIESHDMRTLEDMEAGKAEFADTVIEIATGDIGKVVQLDNHGRTHRVIYRNGADVWHFPNELYVV